MSGQWRQGRRVPRNVYRGDEPIAMVATAEIAAEIVAGMNGQEASPGAIQLHIDPRPETRLVPVQAPCRRCGWVPS